MTTFARNLARLLRRSDAVEVLTYPNAGAALAAGLAAGFGSGSYPLGFFTVLGVFAGLFAMLANPKALVVAGAACSATVGVSIGAMGYFVSGPIAAGLAGLVAASITALLYRSAARTLEAEQADDDWY